MGTFYIQRCEDKAINVYDKYKIDIRNIECLLDPQEIELGNTTASFNTVVSVAVHTNQMNLLSSFTTYIGNRIKGQYDKNARGESKNGVFQLVDMDNSKGYRLTYTSIRDTGKKEGKWKLLELLFLNELPGATLVTSDQLCIGTIACDIYYSDGTLHKNIQGRFIPNKGDWALVVRSDGKQYEARVPIFTGDGYVEGSQTVEAHDETYVLRCEICHNGQNYPLASYDMGATWIMLKPLNQDFINRKESILKYPTGVPVMYYAKELLPDLEFPPGFEILESRDILALSDALGHSEVLWDDFYNKETLYGFVEYLSLNTKVLRSAFWCRNRKGEITGFQFIRKGNRIVVEHIHVENYTYLPVIAIYKI